MFTLISYNFINDLFLSMPISTFILWGIFIVFIVIVCAAYLLGRFFIFKKMGIEPWRGLIPIYGLFLLGKKIWIKWFTWVFVLLIALFALTEFLYMQIYVNSFLYLFAYWVIGANIVMLVLVLAAFFYFQLSLSRSFKKNIGYTIAAFFLPAIFNLVFGLCKAKYAGNITKKRICNIKKQMDIKNKEAYENALKKQKENQLKEESQKVNQQKEESQKVNQLKEEPKKVNQLKEEPQKENQQQKINIKENQQEEVSIKQNQKKKNNQIQNSTKQQKQRIHVRKTLKG